MTVYKLGEHTLLEADTCTQLVRQMHETSLAQAEDDATWMREVSERTTLQSGDRLRYDTCQHFVDDLLKHSLITVVEEIHK